MMALSVAAEFLRRLELAGTSTGCARAERSLT